MLKLKERNELENVFSADELDARLIKLLLLRDYGQLTDRDVVLKFDKFKDRYQASSYKPDFTISDEDV